MRLLVITAHLPPDFVSGATLQVDRLARAMAALGHEVDVVSGAIAAGLDDGAVRTEQRDGFTVHWLGTADRVEQDDDRNWQNDHATDLVRRVIESRRPDVVHAHALQTLGAGGLAAAADAGIPCVVTMHDFWWWCARLFLVDRDMQPCPQPVVASDCACARTAAWRRARSDQLLDVLARVDRILVPSTAMATEVALNGIDADRLVVDENDIAEWTTATTDPTAPAEPHATDRDVHFLYVGGDAAVKGHDVLSAAAERLRDRPGWRLRMYGVAPAPRRRWRRRPPAGPVERLGAFDPHVAPEVYAWADVLVIPSIARESFSLVAREALAGGLAVVTSDCVGPTEAVADGRNGLVVPVGDAEALAAAMARLVDDPELLARLRTHARDHPPAIRTTTTHARQLVELYDSLSRNSS